MAEFDNFQEEFLHYFLSMGIGGLSKTNTEALVMHLIDKYGTIDLAPQKSYPHQQVSQNLQTPVAKIKRLRYEAGLKYGGSIEDQAKASFLAAISNATFELEDKKVKLMIEDLIAKNWLQGQLKNNAVMFDFSFNSEILVVSSDGLFDLLRLFFEENLVADFEKKFQAAAKAKDLEKMKAKLSNLAGKFAASAANAAGVAEHFTSMIG